MSYDENHQRWISVCLYFRVLPVCADLGFNVISLSRQQTTGRVEHNDARVCFRPIVFRKRHVIGFFPIVQVIFVSRALVIVHGPTHRLSKRSQAPHTRVVTTRIYRNL